MSEHKTKNKPGRPKKLDRTKLEVKRQLAAATFELESQEQGIGMPTDNPDIKLRQEEAPRSNDKPLRDFLKAVRDDPRPRSLDEDVKTLKGLL